MSALQSFEPFTLNPSVVIGSAIDGIQYRRLQLADFDSCIVSSTPFGVEWDVVANRLLVQGHYEYSHWDFEDDEVLGVKVKHTWWASLVYPINWLRMERWDARRLRRHGRFAEFKKRPVPATRTAKTPCGSGPR